VLPPAGTPNYLVSESAIAFGFEVRKFTAGPNCGAGGTLSAPVSVAHPGYSVPANPVTQPGTSNTLDMVDDRLMQKVHYLNIGGTESLWVVHNVLSAGTATVALQWAQLDVTGGTIAATPVQQQIYAPDEALHRWMGSLAVDASGDMALGYSTSSATQFPSIAYSGRLAGDTLGTLPQTEVQLTAGGGSQTNDCGGPCQRWGDYSAMSLDPDGCTFWYTNQYYDSPANGSSGNWQTRIGSFKFPSCTAETSSAPTVTTTAISGITSAAAGGGGTVISLGGAAVTQRGICWSTSANPTTADSCTNDGTGPGTFTSAITGLTPLTAYHVRAYAVNSVNTAYGNDAAFTTMAKRPMPPTGLTVH